MPTTILVVEDDEILRWLVMDALSLLDDTRVIECTDADKALLELEHSHAINLVLTDIRMPGKMDGWQLAKTIWTRWPHLPVIVTSGHRNIVDNTLPPQAAFIAKPWTLDDLYQVVRESLRAAA